MQLFCVPATYAPKKQGRGEENWENLLNIRKRVECERIQSFAMPWDAWGWGTKPEESRVSENRASINNEVTLCFSHST